MAYLKKIFVCLFLFLSIHINAQTYGKFFLFLKTGRVVRVELVSFKDSTLKFFENGDFITMHNSELDSIRKTLPNYFPANKVESMIFRRHDVDSAGRVAYQLSYSHSTFLKGPENNVYFGMNYMFPVTNQARMGFNVGLNVYGKNDALLLPINAEWRLHFPTSKPKFPIIVGTQLGYAVNLYSLDIVKDGGFNGDIFIGKSYNFNKVSYFTIFCAWKFARVGNFYYPKTQLEISKAGHWTGPEIKLELRL